MVSSGGTTMPMATATSNDFQYLHTEQECPSKSNCKAEKKRAMPTASCRAACESPADAFGRSPRLLCEESTKQQACTHQYDPTKQCHFTTDGSILR